MLLLRTKGPVDWLGVISGGIVRPYVRIRYVHAHTDYTVYAKANCYAVGFAASY